MRYGFHLSPDQVNRAEYPFLSKPVHNLLTARDTLVELGILTPELLKHKMPTRETAAKNIHMVLPWLKHYGVEVPLIRTWEMHDRCDDMPVLTPEDGRQVLLDMGVLTPEILARGPVSQEPLR
jgi:hypothetical protein